VPSDLREQIKQKISAFTLDVERQVDQWMAARDPVAFRQMELDIAAAGRQLSDAMTSTVVEHIVADPILQAAASQAARQYGSYRHGGRRPVEITLLGGSRVRLGVEYLKVNRRGMPGRRRQTGRRGPGGTGVYPVLAVLGIWFGVTPALAGEVCGQVTDSDLVRAGQAALKRRGIELGHKQTLGGVNKFSTRATEQRDKWLERVTLAPASPGPLQGKRVVIGVDGGRLRERRPARQGRRRTSTGHRRYDAPWREPKLFTIYVIDSDGKVEQEYHPIYDGTLEDCEVVFQMMLGYLKALGAHQASQLIFVGDGAKWIWERCQDLVSALGLSPTQVVEVIDWCHAVAVLHQITDGCKSWTPAHRERWIRRAKKWLHAGKIDSLLQAIDALAVGRRAKDVLPHRDDFARNVARMQYQSFVEAHVPTGSGMVESAIRRVINMRMKSNGMFWLEINAQGMLLLRSYLKAGHFDALVDWSLCEAAPWWQFEARPKTPLSLPCAA
jgi:hypothetical protein